MDFTTIISIPYLPLWILLIMLVVLFLFMMMERINGKVKETNRSCANWDSIEWQLYLTLSVVFPLGIISVILISLVLVWPLLIEERMVFVEKE